MIPLHKLEKLPYTLRLRKVIKLLSETEYRLSAGMEVPVAEYAYLRLILELLVKNTPFPLEAVQVIREAETALKTDHGPNRRDLIRLLNTLRHILLGETGRAPADWDFIDRDGRLDPRQRRCFPGMYVYLEDIRAPFNVGAMFRTAESFGVERVFLSPFCADPKHPRAERTAMGCVSILPWERFSANQPLETLEGPLFALETGGIKLRDFQFPPQGLMIVGSEELGVSPHALAAADASLGRVSIPTYGTKGSLNASVAFGIAMQAWAAHQITGN
ncbi:MAG: TrmH family RNA methyltransferase [Treponema sp.]|jgi:TrmH family RNA methyltransferase|nr:TrmH family RNA methyltransferase [Treponema sp.]